jgi:hypothetical protein
MRHSAYVTLGINDTKLNILPLCCVSRFKCSYTECRYAECRYSKCRYAECRYSKCRYAECRYAECRSALLTVSDKEKRSIGSTPVFEFTKKSCL